MQAHSRGAASSHEGQAPSDAPAHESHRPERNARLPILCRGAMTSDHRIGETSEKGLVGLVLQAQAALPATERKITGAAAKVAVW